MSDEKQGVEPELTPTSAKEWPTASTVEAGETLTLPSGAVARLRRPPLQYMLATGRVPPSLWKRIHAEGAALLLDPLRTLTEAELKTFIDWLIAESFVAPRVSLTRKSGCLYIGDVCEADKEFVMDAAGLAIGG